VGNEVRAELVILRTDGKPTPGDFGRSGEAKRLAAVRDKIPEILWAKHIAESSTVSILSLSSKGSSPRNSIIFGIWAKVNMIRFFSQRYIVTSRLITSVKQSLKVMRKQLILKKRIEYNS